MGLSFMSQLTEHFQHQTIEGMVRTRHPDVGWEISEVGSVS
jgi:hypothetical protein